jgi:hypothetical protein
MIPAHSVRLMRRLDRKERFKRKKEGWKDRKEKGGLQDKNELRWSKSTAPQTDDDQPKRTERDNGLFSQKGSYLRQSTICSSFVQFRTLGFALQARTKLTNVTLHLCLQSSPREAHGCPARLTVVFTFLSLFQPANVIEELLSSTRFRGSR